MKSPWGSPTIIKARLVIVAVMMFVLAVLFWPSHTVYKFSVEPGHKATITIQGKDFEYNLFVHSVDASAGTAELSVFIPAWSIARYDPYSTEQNRAVTLKDFKEGETYRFQEGNNDHPLFKLEQVNDNDVLFSVVDSWTGDYASNRGIQYSTNETAQIAPFNVTTEKVKYAQGEMVNISITNNTGGDIEMCSNLYRIGQLNYSDDRIEWRQLMLNNSGYSANETFILHAGESMGASWNQTEQVTSSGWSSPRTIQVALGQYRIEAIPSMGNSIYSIYGFTDPCYVPPEFPLDKLDYSVIIEIE
jgi:hypothetical protein